MAFAWLIIFISAIVGTRATDKLRKGKASQEEEEYVPIDDSDAETESEDWEATGEAAQAAAELKGKAKAAPEQEQAAMGVTPMKRKSLAQRSRRSHGEEDFSEIGLQQLRGLRFWISSSPFLCDCAGVPVFYVMN